MALKYLPLACIFDGFWLMMNISVAVVLCQINRDGRTVAVGIFKMLSRKVDRD